MARLTVLLCILVAFLNGDARSQDASVSEPNEAVRHAEIEERMKKRAEFARKWFMGGVYQPSEKANAIDPNEVVKRIKLHNYYTGMVAGIYANVSRKEVLVSKKVARKQISALIENVSQAEALRLLEQELHEVGVEVVKLGSETVAFIELDVQKGR